MDYFELAEACSMRMCPELEKKFPDFHGRQLELMMYLCIYAYKSEIYDGLCGDTWLRTTITLKDDHVDEPSDSLQPAHVFFNNPDSREIVNEPAASLQQAHVFSNNPDSREIMLMAELFNGTPMCPSSWKELEKKKNQSELTSRIEIRWNILPRRSYWERLQKVQRQSNWTRVQSLLLWRTPCCSRGGFIPITVIDQARQRGSSLKEKVDEWRENGGGCDLATRLQSGFFRPTTRRKFLRTIEAGDVESMGLLGTGNAATVYKVSWRNGTYAMKSFNNSGSTMPLKEQAVSKKVLHPHIIHVFGHFCSKVDGKWSLLMEMLDTSLTLHAIEKRREGVKQLFSREDTLDVLLQIASAVKYLHDEGVVHGDLKPANIVLEIPENGRHILAKVTDFGDAQFVEQSFTPAGGGTTRFAAPELLKWRKNSKNVKFDDLGKIDVYGFGGVAHEVLTGYPVYFERKNDEFGVDFGNKVIAGELKPSGSKVWRKSPLKKRFPVELIKLVEKCWNLDPKDRPSFSDICDVLERCKSVEKSAIDHFKFIALTLLIFIVMSSLCRFIRCGLRSFPSESQGLVGGSLSVVKEMADVMTIF